jgi:signal transduction histidine kinase
LFVGIGFVTITIIDFLHAVLSFNAAGNSNFLDYFIPQTWFAGRTFLGAMLVIAVIKYAPEPPAITATNLSTFSSSQSSLRKDFSRIEKEKSKEAIEEGIEEGMIGSGEKRDEGEKINYDRRSDMHDNKLLHNTLLFPLIMLAVLAISVVVFSFFTIFPGIVTDDYAIHRPYEIPALALFSVSLLYFYKKRIYKTNDFFYKGILGALIIDIFGQIIMSLSATNFHTAHNIAHILKNSGYFIIIVSLAISSIQYIKIAKEREELIRYQYEWLKESDKMKDEFVNIAAHELRTPIQPILGLSEIIRPKVNTEDRGYVDVIIRNARRLQRLTEEILDVTKIESQSLKLKKDEFNLNDVIVNCINDITMNRQFNNNDKVKKQNILYEPNDILLKADRGRVSQVISNLLSNAAKFTPEGTISIVSDLNDNQDNKNDEAIINVKDNGQGIDPDMLPKLFSKFATKSFSGTGLGLYISKSIVEAHGGRIWAENNPNGEGATFSFSLPIIQTK